MAQSNNTISSQLSHLGLSGAEFARQLERLLSTESPRLRRLWSYYRNPMRTAAASDESSARPYTQAQEWGLPRRIVGDRTNFQDPGRREVVIENDIAWRLDTMVDFLFGKPIVLSSAAPDPARRETITQLLRAILANHGGLQFLQQLALTGAVHGYVDVLVKLLPEPDPIVFATITTQELGFTPASDPRRAERTDAEQSDPNADPAPAPSGPASRENRPDEPGASTISPEATASLARRIRLEVVEPARALPLLRDLDYRIVDAYAQVYRVPRREGDEPRRSPWLKRLFTARGFAEPITQHSTIIELITSDRWMTFQDEMLVASGRNTLGEIPLVHIQNVATAFAYAGGSDVEPLVPLQDELNTRLSDRAHRITMQSFRMYLGKGIDNFVEQQVAPGRMWMSENPEAQIIEFGGDAACPSEDAHIREVREAMDKQSGVSPIAAGAIKGRIGRLTSAAALRVTMLALLARTERKRIAYGGGVARLCELALKWLDHAGLFKTSEAERQIEIHWPHPVPLNEIERLDEARAKRAVGVPKEIVLKELGYAPSPREGTGPE